jgi:hypothetical protein
MYALSHTQGDSDDPDLPRLETTEHWIALCAFLCVITLLNVVSHGTYRNTDQTEHLSITGSLEYLREHADANELSIRQRRDFVWGRGLVAHTLDVLYQRHRLDLRERLFEPMLGHYIFHMERAFANAYPSNVKISPSNLFHTSNSRKNFKQQIKWVLQGKSEAQKHYKSLLSDPPESLVMKFNAWQLPEGPRNQQPFPVVRRK